MSVETSLMILAICAIFLSLSLIIFFAVAIKFALDLNQRIEELSVHTKKAFLDGSEIVEKIKDNIDATKPIFHSIAKVGYMMNDFTDKFSHEVKEKPFRAVSFTSMKRKETKILDLLEFLGLGILMWQKFKKGADDE